MITSQVYPPVLPVFSLCLAAALAPRAGAAGWGRRLVGAVGILRPFELHLEPLHSDLKAIHGLYGSLSTARVIETNKPWGGCAERRNKMDREREKEGGMLVNFDVNFNFVLDQRKNTRSHCWKMKEG